MINYRNSLWVLLLLLCLGANKEVVAQINNYWSMGSNTYSSLLGGAVVGGGAGDVAIFYNPAAIMTEDQKQIALNASLVSFNSHSYQNSLGYNRDLDYLEWGVKPRFLSYQFKIKDKQRLTYQIAVFSRIDQLTELYDQQTMKTKSITGNVDLDYTASYDFSRRYSDYWVGVGASYVVNSKFSIGLTLFGSGKSLRYYQSSVIDVDPETSLVSKNANWASVEKQYLYVISLIPKVGFLYDFGQLSMGLNITIPSIRLWGDGYAKRTLSNTNVVYEGVLKDDYLKNEYNNYMVANIKEPLAIALGLAYISNNEKSNYFFSMEYFAPISTYRLLDNTKISSWGEDDFQPGGDFLSYKYGGKEVLNVAVGYEHIVSEKLSILSGFKTNFSAYDVSQSGEWETMKEYVIMSPPLYHISLGARFRYRSNTIVLGTEYILGISDNNIQLANYGYPGVYIEDEHFALQNVPTNSMKYVSNALSFYIGYAFDF